MKKKWKFVMTDAAKLLATGTSIAHTAKQLGIDRSTVHRHLTDASLQLAIEAERVSRRTAAAAPPAGSATDLEPATFRATILAAYDLTPAEVQLLELAVDVLTMARDVNNPAPIRLTAAGRFQALLRHLKLEESDGEVEKDGNVRKFPRRA